jgi:predicted MarR family transcription regulator
MTYQLRRLRLHGLIGLIERIPKTHRYQLTTRGGIAIDKYTKIYNRVLRPELATLTNSPPSLKT